MQLRIVFHGILATIIEDLRFVGLHERALAAADRLADRCRSRECWHRHCGIVRLPADYLSTFPKSALRKVRTGWLDLFVGLSRNLLGLALVGLGALLSLPAVPGQGLLTIFAGVLLLDLPGKRWILIPVFRQRRLLQAINRVRAKWSRCDDQQFLGRERKVMIRNAMIRNFTIALALSALISASAIPQTSSSTAKSDALPPPAAAANLSPGPLPAPGPGSTADQMEGLAAFHIRSASTDEELRAGKSSIRTR